MIPVYRAKKIDSDEYVVGYCEYILNEGRSINTINSGCWLSWVKLDNEGFRNRFEFEVDPTTLAISFDGGKSFLKLSDLEIHTCTDFELKYTNMKMRDCKELQPPNGNIFTIITDKGR